MTPPLVWKEQAFFVAPDKFLGDQGDKAGETVRFKVNTPSRDYRLDIYRLGYYGGSGARKVASLLPSAVLPQPQPACAADIATGQGTAIAAGKYIGRKI